MKQARLEQVPATDWILHVDLDQFIAAVEVIRRPELRGRPVVVGGVGDPTQRRAVVATASYEAREFGVRSGMPLRTAARRCPDAAFLPSDPPAYEAASQRLMATLRRFPVTVEVVGWDEAFLGARTDDPQALVADIQRAVTAETGLSCSVGQEAAANRRAVVRVAVKVRFAPFITLIRSSTLAAPTSDAPNIERAALALLERFEHTRPVRLLGVRVEFDRAASKP